MANACLLKESPGKMLVRFDYDVSTKDKIKVLPGAEWDKDGQQWTVPTMSLPALKSIFATLTVEPAVLADYYQRLRRLLEDFAAGGLTVRLEGSQVRSKCLRKGELGKHLGEVIETHRHGIVQVLRQGPIVPRVVERPVVPVDVVPEPADDGLAGSYLKGVKNAHKNVEKKAQIVKAAQAKRRKKQVEVV